MAFPKIKNSASPTFTGLLVTLVLIIGLFIGMFQMVTYSLEASSQTLDEQYNDTYTEILNAQANLDSNVKELETDVRAVTEADASFVTSLWNGLKGLGQAVKTTLVFFDTAFITVQAFLGLSFLPGWVLPLISIGILGVIILLILGKLTGEQKT